MATLQEVIRRITIFGKTEGVDKATADLQALAAAQGGVAVASEKTTATTLSMEKRINSLQRSLDAEYRAQQDLAKVNRDLASARAQGLITAQRQSELSSLAAVKFGVEGAAASKTAAAYRLLKESMAGFATGLVGGFAAIGISQVPRMISDAVGSLDDLNDLSRTIGITTDRLQELQYAGNLLGVDQGTLNGALEKFSVNLGLASQGSGKLYEILQANHVIISGDLTTDLENYAELIRNARNEEERNVLTTTAFGRSAQEMGRLFDEGAEAIRAAGIEARTTGAIIDKETLAAAGRLDDQLQKIRERTDAAGARIAVAFGPAQVWLMEQFADSAQRIAFAMDSIKAGKVQDAIGIFAGEGYGQFSRQRYIDRNMKAGTFQMTPGLSGGAVDDFYGSFPQIEKPLAIEVRGGRTNLPTKDGSSSADAYQKLIDTTERRISQLGVEAEALGRTGVAADLYRNTQELLLQAAQTEIELTPERIEQLTQMAERLTDTQLTLEGLHMQMENRTPWETMGEEIRRLDELMRRGKIGADDYAVGIGKAAETMVGRYAAGANDVLGNVERLTDALGLEGKEAFEAQKSLSIARAVVAGGEAIVHSYNAGSLLPGGPITGFAFAGIAAAATAAQIAAISSTSYNSKTAIGAAGSSAGAATAAPAATPGQGITYVLHGDRNTPTTFGKIEDIISGINEYYGSQGKALNIIYRGA